MYYFFTLPLLKKTLNIFLFGFFKASITACFPTIKKDDLLFINLLFFFNLYDFLPLFHVLQLYNKNI